MDDKTTLRILGHYSPSAAADMRKHMGDRALLQDVAAAPDKLLIEPCGPDLERIDAVPHWKLARWFVGLGQVRGVTPEWASSYADRVPGEAGARLKCAFKIYRASKLLWPGDSVLVAEFIRRRSELGLTMHSGAAACSEALAAPAAPDALTSASVPAAGHPEAVTAATQAEAVPGAGIVRHAIRHRRSPLAAVFARAKREATDSACPHSVWAALVVMATGKAPPPELTDYREDKGIQATGTRSGWLSKSAFIDRWRRGAV